MRLRVTGQMNDDQVFWRMALGLGSDGNGSDGNGGSSSAKANESEQSEILTQQFGSFPDTMFTLSALIHGDGAHSVIQGVFW